MASVLRQAQDERSWGKTIVRTFLFLFAALALPAAAQARCDDPRASARVALVIGNGGYLPGQWAHLPNATSDAEAVCEGFAEQGFRVIKVEDADHDAMAAAILQFAALAPKADVALFYYAGHGFEYAGINWLVPTDAPVETARGWLKGQFIDLASALNAVKLAKHGLVFLDACRTRDAIVRIKEANPGGLEEPAGTINLPFDFKGVVFYSTARGASAFDAAPVTARNSPFAQAVVERLTIPDLELRDYIVFVIEDVERRTTSQQGGPQLPFPYGTLRDKLYFNQPPPPPALAALEEPAAPTPAATGQPNAGGAVVIASNGPDAASYPVGKRLARGSRVVLRAGSVVRIIDTVGARTLTGPGAFDISASSSRPAVAASSAPRRARTGAIRGESSTPRPTSPGTAQAIPTLTRKFEGLDPGRAAIALAALDKETLAREDEPQIISRVLGRADAVSLGALAESGDPTAQYLYGAMLYMGLGVQKNLPAARIMLGKAAASGLPAGMLEYGYFLENFGDLPGDKVAARELFEKAAATGYPKAQSHLAYRLWNAAPPEKDMDRAMTLWSAAAAQGYPYAIYAVGVYGGRMNEARSKLTELANMGDRSGDSWLCELAEYGGTTPTAFAHCLKAAQAGFAGAMALTARLYATGLGVARSNKEATYWARLALAKPDFEDPNRRPQTEALLAQALLAGAR